MIKKWNIIPEGWHYGRIIKKKNGFYQKNCFY